jgi:hypothetical protein
MFIFPCAVQVMVSGEPFHIIVWRKFAIGLKNRAKPVNNEFLFNADHDERGTIWK